jgi:hypothetical protein
MSVDDSARSTTHRRKNHGDYYTDRSGVELVVTEHVLDYRDAVDALVRQDDVALEIGCAGGKTTDALGRRACVAYGVDKTFSPHTHAEQQSFTTERTQFAQVDAYDLGGLLQLSKRAAQEARELHESEAEVLSALPTGFSVILIDISGSAKLSAVLDLIERYETCFKDSLRLLVIKSFRLACLLDRARPFESLAPSANNQRDATSLL